MTSPESTPLEDDQRGGWQADILDSPEAGPRIIRGSLIQLAGFVVGTGATVLSSAVVIRHLGKVNTGRFLTVTALITIVSNASDLGLGGMAIREYASRDASEGKRLMSNLLGIRLSVTAVGVVLAIAFSVVVSYTPSMVVGTMILGACTIVMAMQQSWALPMRATLRFGWVSGIQLAMQVGIAVEAVLLAVAGAGLEPFFAMQLPVLIPAMAVTLLVGGSDVRFWISTDFAEWRRLVGSIVPYSLAVVLSVTYYQLALILVSVLSNSAETAYFGVAFRVLFTLTTVPPLVVATALPVLARSASADRARFAYASGRLAQTSLIAGATLALALFLGARAAIDVVGGGSYGVSVTVLRLLSFALLGTFLISARGYALLSLDRLRPMLIANGAALVLLLGVGVPLTRAYGAKGAAAAMLVAELSLAVGYEMGLGLHRRELRLSAKFVSRLLLCLAVSVPAGLALPFGPVAAAAAGLAVFGVAISVAGLVPAEIRHAFTPRARQ